MGDVVKFPGIVIKGELLNYIGNPIASVAPEADTAIIEVEDEVVQDDEFDEEMVDEYVARLHAITSPQAYLDCLKEFLDQDEYEDILLAIMDSEYFDDLDEVSLTFVEGYFQLMGFDPEDPRVA